MPPKEESPKDSALAFVYLASNVRPEGVLRRDCFDYSEEIESLIKSGLVAETKWYSHDLYILTPSGQAIAHKLVESRIKQHRAEFQNFLSTIPQRLLAILIEDVFLQSDPWYLSQRAFNVRDDNPASWIFSCNLDRGQHRCLLKDHSIFYWRTRTLAKLEESGLSCRARSYVSSQGGRIDPPQYCISAEVVKLFSDHSSSSPPANNLLPKQIEISHRSYHFLEQLTNLHHEIQLSLLMTIQTNCHLTIKEGDEILQDLVSEKIVEVVNGTIKILDFGSLKAFALEHFQAVVDYVLGGAESSQSREEVTNQPLKEPMSSAGPEDTNLFHLESPPLEFQVTYPPFDDGRHLVLGRGKLKDKICWGFEEGSGTVEDSIISTNLFDINQPHVGSFQQTRTGKSTLAASVLLQVAFQGIPVVVIDPKPDYVANIVPVQKTFDEKPDLKDGIIQRFKQSKQDLRGFDLTRPIEFDLDGKKVKLEFRIYSFDKDLKDLKNVHILKLPFIVLPSLDDSDFSDQCNSIATNVASFLPRSQGKAYNVILSKIIQEHKNNHKDSDYLLSKQLLDEIDQFLPESKEEKKRLVALKLSISEFYTANSYLYAQSDRELATVDEMVKSPFVSGDTVTVSIVDVSNLSQEKKNPILQNYVSQICGQLLNFARKKSAKKTVKMFVILDEAQNYLPSPSDTYNYVRVLITRGASLGIKAWLIAQSPQSVEKEARKQFTTLILAKINSSSVRDEISKFMQNEEWSTKLSKTDLGRVLVVNEETARSGGKLVVSFTTPQTVDVLSNEQIARLSRHP